MAFSSYYPEMGEKKPAGQIEASLSHDGKHYFVYTPLTLSGRGVDFLGTETAETLIPGSYRVGWHRYKVTLRAFDVICKQYSVTSEALL
jgi:hypothetical protein